MKYHDIISQVALRSNALSGAQMTALEASYNTSPLTATQFKSANFFLSAMLDSARITENEIALAVSNNRDHTWRPILADQVLNLASGASIPAVGSSGVAIIGAYGSVTEHGTGKPLTSDMTLDEIRALIDNVNNWRKINPYQFVINLPQIYHTVTAVDLDVQVWDADDAETDIAANETLLFPDAEGAYFSGLATKLKNLDVRFVAFADSFKEEYAAWLTAISGGKTKP
jgi:hypothetical protein